MFTPLTKGAIEKILTDVQVEAPVLQVITLKGIQSAAHDRYRVRLGDGIHANGSCMLGTQLNNMAHEITDFSIIRINRYVCNVISDIKKVIIILDLTILHRGEEVKEIIGNLKSFDPPIQQGGAAAAVSTPAGTSKDTSNPFDQSSRANAFGRGPINDNNQSSSAASVPVGVHPINSLTPYQNKWTICARVTSKSAIRTWNNSRGTGKLFSMDFIDESGEIRATAFNDQCDKFYNMIELDKVYYVSTAQLKTANKQYSSLKNDYEMTFNQGTSVTLCQQKTNIPTMQFQFISIDQLEKVEKDTTIDVLGVVKDTDDVVTITQKTTGKELKKRDLQIVDESSKEVRLTLWGTQAENFDGSLHPVIAVKGVKVSDFNGKSLSVLSSSSLQINPDITEAHKLRAWYENTGCNIQTVNLSGQRGAGGGMEGNLKMIGEAVAENLGCRDQADYYCAKGTLAFLKKENCMYQACPSEGCNKKVIDMNSGVFRCEKCNKEYDSFNWRLMLSASIADGTESIWLTVFQDQAEALLGCKSTDLGIMKDQDENGFQAVFNAALFKEFVFKLRVKMESYNDEKKLKTTVASVQPLSCKEYNKSLFQELKNIAGLP